MRWVVFRSSSSTLLRDASEEREPRVSLTEAGEDTVRGGEGCELRGVEWGPGEACGWLGGWEGAALAEP